VIACSETTNGSWVKRILVYFRCDQDKPEYSTETVDIWPTSFLMRSRARLALGTVLLLRLRVPVEISGSPFYETCSTGRVVSEHRLEDGTVGYRVEIEQQEP
jgi:hypothetical protein